MPTKKQHFVPRVYLKAWESKVVKNSEPNKPFDGVYLFDKDNKADGFNIKSILWKPHIYTVRFRYSFICKSCPLIRKDFVDQIFTYLKTSAKQPIYGKIGYSIIATKKSVDKHLHEIDECDFYYADGNIASKESILNQIHSINSYVLETAFDNFFEKHWENTLSMFIECVHNGIPLAIGQSERTITDEAAYNMLSSFFIMLCRNPKFDAMGTYKKIEDSILTPLFDSILESDDHCSPDFDSKKEAEELMTGIWYSELYKMLHKNTGGFYHTVLKHAISGCQMILFEAYDDAGFFVTSDNPAFEHISTVERINHSGFVFPMTPKYLLFIAKGNEPINVVDHRYANADTIKYFNRIILQHKTDCWISSQKNINSNI